MWEKGDHRIVFCGLIFNDFSHEVSTASSERAPQSNLAQPLGNTDIAASSCRSLL